jgi:carbon monoxide dehydrogenase subunit G
MKFNGSYKFQASREKVFTALLDPTQLQASIPGCESARCVRSSACSQPQ